MRLLPAGYRIARPLIMLLVAAAALSDFLSPSPPGELNIGRFFAPPSRIHFFNARGGFNYPPITYRLELVNPVDIVYQENRSASSPLRFFCEGYNYRLLGLFPTSRHLACGEDFHPLGTDDLGRDVLARVLAGARTSIVIVLAGICLYAVLGLAIGSLAAVIGGWVDSALMRFSEFILALPALYLILALRALLPPRMPFWQTVLLTVGTIAGVAWPPMARGVRGLILQLKCSVCVEAARSIGCSRWQIFRRHILPALPPLVAAQAAVAAPLFLLGEVVLSFLNMGFQDAGESWGSMLQSLRDQRVFTDFWWNLAPLLFVFVTLFGLNLLSRGARGEGTVARL